MAKEDFCFTYYDGDAARDKAHMTRLERGAYDDLISAQRKFGHLTLTQIKKVLSRDFEECWPALEMILKVDENEKYFIEWVMRSVEKMKTHSKIQKEKSEKYWKDKKLRDTHGKATGIPRDQSGIALGVPLEDEDGSGLEKREPLGSEKVKAIAKKVWEDKIWQEQICMGQSMSTTELGKWMAQFNASVANDHINDFDVGAYKKMIQGWISLQKSKGRKIESIGPVSSGPPLKTI